MKKSVKYAEMCAIVGEAVFGLRQNGSEISRENLIKVCANKRLSCPNELEAECYQQIIGKLTDA